MSADLPPDLLNPAAASSTLEDLWRLTEQAARAGDQAMAGIYFQRWLVESEALVQRACDVVLERERPRGRAAG